MSPKRKWLVAVLFAPAFGLAAELRMCVDQHAHLPYLTPQGGGTVGRLVERAAREAGFKLTLLVAPVARCRVEVERGTAHAYPLTPYLPAVLPFAQYPMQGGLADSTRATVRARVALFRPVGGQVKFDGVSISGLDRKVLVPFGSLVLSEVLRARQVPFDQEGRSLAINFAKMLAGRGDAAAGFEAEGLQLMAQPPFAGKIEMLPLPLFEQTYYLGVSKDYYARHGVAVERLWDAIGRLNKAAEAQEK
ncbi:hypothetical protein [Massilia sp. CF038]|uniref:hypothetical protein n=1 Tax=Massilia sp. CF038 TaxID=1881045 RepID=UPI000911918E|nr:hypothetical protein [Massilia sp. CF038]SHG34699.1 hypothetical protein SAMN05428948_0008 [Massilia sp. CF038]